MAAYSLGLDFGSLSVRALIVNVETGQECGTAVCDYPHGILDTALPDGTPLPHGFVLQLPEDYWHSMGICVRQAMADSGVSPQAIRGIGICTTASTILPTTEDGTPLSALDGWKSNPHAYMKMWKHRGAIDIAEQMKQTAADRNEAWFEEYGRVITCEWMMPKVLELAMHAPDVYRQAAHILEVGDWLVQRLTGAPSRSIALARCNGLMRLKERPSSAYFAAICPDAADVVREKLSGEYRNIGSIAGYLTAEAAAHLGLEAGTPVSPAMVDAQATVLASGACRNGDMAMIVGTSAVEILLSDKPRHVEGIHISAQDAAVPGMYSLGGGQSCVGDGFDWFVSNCVPHKAWEDAQSRQQDIHTYLMEQAAGLQPGESGLLALDWWNGLRSPSFRFDLKGCIMGFTLRTRAHEIYRAMLEASVFGARRVVDLLCASDCPVQRIFAGGGIAWKNPLMMQIYADVLQKRIDVCASRQTGALGSAMLGAMAAGCTREHVLANMTSAIAASYFPSKEAGLKYERLYQAYLQAAAWYESAENQMFI